MLHLYFTDKERTRPDMDFVFDVELEFKGIDLTGSNTEKALIYEIDQAKYYDYDRVTDRFGTAVYSSLLSTGAKVALCVLYRPSKLINGIECGFNAMTSIITNCTEGNLLIYNYKSGFATYDGKDRQIDVKLDNYRFTSLDRLNQYILEERPFEPYMDKGVELCLN